MKNNSKKFLKIKQKFNTNKVLLLINYKKFNMKLNPKLKFQWKKSSVIFNKINNK